MTTEELKAILDNHAKWVKNSNEGFRANLSGANLSRASLSGANLSRAENLLDPSKWIAETFESNERGIIVYKAIGCTDYPSPDYWVFQPGQYLTEVCNSCRVNDCGCGVNFGTLQFCQQQYSKSTIWKCLIHWKDLPGVVVPYNTNGKARCARLELLEIVNLKSERESDV